MGSFMSAKYIFEKDKSETIDCSDNCKISVVTNTAQFKDFFEVPWLVYKDDDAWVPPLWEEYKEFFRLKNPFWKHADARLFIAYKDGKPVGRIATIIDFLFTKKEKEDIGYFGFFECIDDYGVAKALFDAAKSWLKTNKMKKMRGPIDGRVDVRTGLLLDGYGEQPFIFASYNPKYYVAFVLKYGMKKCRDQLVYWLDMGPPIPQYLKDAAEKVEKMGIRIRGFKRLRAGKEIKWWIPMMMKTFSFHWGYIDVPEEEVRTRFGIKQIRWVADPGLFLVAESLEGKPIAFKWTTPDFNQAIKPLNGRLGILGYIKFLLYVKKINRGRFNFVGIKKEWQGKSLGSAMNYYTMLEMKRREYPGAECGWIDEENIASQRTIEKTGAKLYRKYRVYEIKI
jgi:hypothetical protein